MPPPPRQLWQRSKPSWLPSWRLSQPREAAWKLRGPRWRLRRASHGAPLRPPMQVAPDLGSTPSMQLSSAKKA